MRFIANIDPVADANIAVEQAKYAEKLGYDGILMQDHAYLGRFAETTTLLAAIGAVTERITFGANVLTAPFRLPALLAKEIATLDVISGGRAELGLGVGANVDGIAAMGGPTFADKSEMFKSYRDALHIIRGLWESDGKPYSYDGDVQSVQDVDFGPTPTRRIPIMTGAMGPQSLKLTAELADGISVSSRYVPMEKLPWFREQLDAGAAAFERDAAELFINYNVMGYIHNEASNARPRNEGVYWGDIDWWTERLNTIKEMGVSQFTFWPVHGDKNEQLRTFIEEVAPTVR